MKKQRVTNWDKPFKPAEEEIKSAQPTEFDYETEVSLQLKTCDMKLSFLEWSHLQHHITAIAHIAEEILIEFEETNPVKCVTLAIDLYFIRSGKYIAKENVPTYGPGPLPFRTPISDPPPANPDLAKLTPTAEGVTINGGKFQPFHYEQYKPNKEN